MNKGIFGILQIFDNICHQFWKFFELAAQLVRLLFMTKLKKP
jgi:hypothetical protein